MRTRAALLLMASALAGCGITRTVRTDPALFTPVHVEPADALDGRALVLTTPADDAQVVAAEVYRYHDAGLRLTLKAPLGAMAREAALRVFGQVFRGGADVSSDPAIALAPYRVVLTPRVRGAAYRAIGSAVEIFQVELALDVAVRSGTGAPLLSRTYDPGVFVYGPGRRHGEAYAIQDALRQIMLDVAADVRRCLREGCPASAELPEARYLRILDPKEEP